MAFPGGCLVSFTPEGGSAYNFTAFRTSVPVLTPTVSRGYGISLNSPYAINRDAAIAKMTLRITWKFLALSNDPTNPFADMVSQLNTLWNSLYLGSSQLGTVIAYVAGASGSTVSFLAAVVPGVIQLVPQQPRHTVSELSFDCLSAFS